MIPPEIKNPFLKDNADDTVLLPAGHVPELHAGALARCQLALDQTRHTGHKIGLLVRGEAGRGKSHLIAQFRPHLARAPRAVRVGVRFQEAFRGRLWRHVRAWLVKELLWGYAEPAHGANGLLRVLRNRFPRWAAAAQGPAGGLLDWLIGRSHGRDNLHPHLEELSRTCDLDYGLRKV